MSTLPYQSLGLRPAQWKAVERKARHEGKTAPEYVRSLIEQDLLADKPFDEILCPVREDFQKNGITEPQLTALVRCARNARSKARRDRR